MLEPELLFSECLGRIKPTADIHMPLSAYCWESSFAHKKQSALSPLPRGWKLRPGEGGRSSASLRQGTALMRDYRSQPEQGKEVTWERHFPMLWGSFLSHVWQFIHSRYWALGGHSVPDRCRDYMEAGEQGKGISRAVPRKSELVLEKECQGSGQLLPRFSFQVNSTKD